MRTQFPQRAADLLLHHFDRHTTARSNLQIAQPVAAAEQEYVPATRWKATDDTLGQFQFLRRRGKMLRAGFIGGMLFDFTLVCGEGCAVQCASEIDGEIMRAAEAEGDWCANLGSGGVTTGAQASLMQRVVKGRRRRSR